MTLSEYLWKRHPQGYLTLSELETEILESLDERTGKMFPIKKVVGIIERL